MSRHGKYILEAAGRSFRTGTWYGDSTASSWTSTSQSFIKAVVSASTGSTAPVIKAVSRGEALWRVTKPALQGAGQIASTISHSCAPEAAALGRRAASWIHFWCAASKAGSGTTSTIGTGWGLGVASISGRANANGDPIMRRLAVYMYGSSGRGLKGSATAAVAAAKGFSVFGAQKTDWTRPMGLIATRPQLLLLPWAGAGVAVGTVVAATSTTSAGLSSSPWGPLTNSSGAIRCVWRDSRGYEHFQGRGHLWSTHHPGRLMYVTAAMGAVAVAYYLYCLETVPYTGRRHAIMLVSPYREQWMGKMGFEQFKALARAEHKLLPDVHPDVQRVRRLGSAIAAVAVDGAGGGSYDHMRGLQWEFAVINDGMVNAAVLPGGKVIVFSGLLKLLGHNDDELAAVMAHEVGHVLARHPAENMSTLNVWLLINTALRLTLGFALPDVAMYLALVLPNSRKNEHEADVIGLRLMSRACFDPAAATTMLDKLNRAENDMKQGRVMGPSLPPFLSTHPLTTDRVKLLEKDLPEAYKLFEESGCVSSRGDFRRAVDAWMGGVW